MLGQGTSFYPAWALLKTTALQLVRARGDPGSGARFNPSSLEPEVPSPHAVIVGTIDHGPQPRFAVWRGLIGSAKEYDYHSSTVAGEDRQRS